MSELRVYLEKYAKSLQDLLKKCPDDDSLLKEAKQEFGKDKNDARYLVLAKKMAQFKKDVSDWEDNKPVPDNRPVDKF